ncbi:MAG: glycosyltransferase family 87 protein, partial [Anaerolineales bacterium]
MEKNRINQNINLWRVFQITAASSLAIIYIFQWGRMITTPSLRTGADFMAFYAAGRVAQEEGFSKVYDIGSQHEIEQIVVGFDLTTEQVLLYNHVPYLIPILQLLVSADYIGSFICWSILMFCIYVIANVFFLNTISPARNKKSYSALLAGTLLFFPFFNGLLLGQDTALLFLGLAIWCAGILKKQDWLAATGLALTTIRPHICLTLAIPFFFRHRKVWWRFFVIAGLLMLTSVLMIGKEGTFGFINLLQISASGTWHGMNESDMFNLIGLMLRAFPAYEPGFVRILGWVGYIAGIGLASVLWIKAHDFDGWLLGMSIIIALVFAPHLHYHDLTLLIIPLIFSATTPDSTILPERMAQLPMGVSLFLVIQE